MSRSEDHARFLEYAHIMVGMIVLVTFFVITVMYGNHMYEVYSKAGAELPYLTVFALKTRWVTAALPVAYGALIGRMKQRGARRGRIFLATYGFAILGTVVTFAYVFAMGMTYHNITQLD